MVTAFGKFCRKLRIDNGQIMMNMADKLGVSPSFLSAVENGKKSIPTTWFKQLTDVYGLSKDAQNELKKSIELSVTEVKFNLKSENDNDREIIVAFARQFKTMDNSKKELLKNLLVGHGKDDGY